MSDIWQSLQRGMHGARREREGWGKEGHEPSWRGYELGILFLETDFEVRT